ncbi:uncharacterized protein KY384_008028 [Bacidia gigantensis]|uniref:uncharacterized protein n=1 Tax=Bacidia gigantensis TaxID=2732470 RepID=UPI001D03BDAC|nr:uncharacterized protein KY384_008028 [Bacidia gigantensis]KAG8527284.1 hypothetical protein KY384_008028 [Bacidia gigantensis]
MSSASKPTSRTLSWLDSLPSPASLFCDPASTSELSRKRRKTQQQSLPIRTALGCISSNIMAPRSNQSPQKPNLVAFQPQTPPKPLNDDDDKTPRPHLHTDHSLPARAPSSPHMSPTRSSRRIAEKAPSSEAGSSALSSSALIEENDALGRFIPHASTTPSSYLHSDRFEITKASFNAADYPFPPPRLERLTEDLLQIGQGISIIPYELKAHAFPDMFAAERNKAYVTLKGSVCPVQLPGGQEAIDEFYKELRKILAAASECDEKDCSEPSWNDEVHSRILRLALQGQRKDTHIWYRNVTMHKITKEAKPPLSGKAQDGSMVDFAILIEPPNETLAKLNTIFSSNCLNQTDAKDLEKTILATNIETKVQGARSRAKGICQLAVWTLAQFTKLKLLNPGLQWTDLPTMPVILTERHSWTLLVMRMISETEILVHIGQQVGNTGTIRGLFQVIATIQRLARWSREDYMKWWEDQILNQDTIAA